MPGLVPGIHDFLRLVQDVDGRDKPGHDEEVYSNSPKVAARLPQSRYSARLT
jgi:hypothetical protein